MLRLVALVMMALGSGLVVFPGASRPATGPSPNERCSTTDTPRSTTSNRLHDAAARNLTSIVRLLCERGADVNVKNGRGLTPLDLAVAASRRRPFLLPGPDWSGPSTIDVLEEFGAIRSDQAPGAP